MAFQSWYCPQCGASDWQSDALTFEEVICPHCQATYTLMPGPGERPVTARGPGVGRTMLVVFSVAIAMMLFLMICGYYVLSHMHMGC